MQHQPPPHRPHTADVAAQRRRHYADRTRHEFIAAHLQQQQQQKALAAAVRPKSSSSAMPMSTSTVIDPFDSYHGALATFTSRRPASSLSEQKEASILLPQQLRTIDSSCNIQLIPTTSSRPQSSNNLNSSSASATAVRKKLHQLTQALDESMHSTNSSASHHSPPLFLSILSELGSLLPGSEGMTLTKRLCQRLQEEIFLPPKTNATAFTITQAATTSSRRTYRDELLKYADKIKRDSHIIQQLEHRMKEHESVIQQWKDKAEQLAAAVTAATSASSVTKPSEPMIPLSRFYSQLDQLSHRMVDSQYSTEQSNELKQQLMKAELEIQHLHREKLDLQRHLELTHDRLADAQATAATTSQHHATITSIHASPEFQTLFQRYQTALKQTESLEATMASQTKLEDIQRKRAVQAEKSLRESKEKLKVLEEENEELKRQARELTESRTPRPEWKRYQLSSWQEELNKLQIQYEAKEKQQQQQSQQQIDGTSASILEESSFATIAPIVELPAKIRHTLRGSGGDTTTVSSSSGTNSKRSSMRFDVTSLSHAFSAAPIASTTFTSAVTAPKRAQHRTSGNTTAIHSPSSFSPPASPSPRRSSHASSAFTSPLNSPLSITPQQSSGSLLVRTAPGELLQSTCEAATVTVLPPRAVPATIPSSSEPTSTAPSISLQHSFFPPPPGLVEVAATETVSLVTEKVADVQDLLLLNTDTTASAPSAIGASTQNRVMTLYLKYREEMARHAKLYHRAESIISQLQTETKSALDAAAMMTAQQQQKRGSATSRSRRKAASPTAVTQ